MSKIKHYQALHRTKMPPKNINRLPANVKIRKIMLLTKNLFKSTLIYCQKQSITMRYIVRNMKIINKLSVNVTKKGELFKKLIPTD